MRSLEVAQQLKTDGVDVAVLHVPTIKPLDEATILAEVRRLGRLVVVAENHSVIGGLGEAVASLLMRSGVARRSARSACRMPSSTRAHCPRCTIGTASPPRR
jgi:transketolase